MDETKDRDDIAQAPPLAVPRARHLHYVDRLQKRPTSRIDLVVIHSTERPDLFETRRFSEHIHYPDSRTGNAGHYYIDRDGAMEEWVPLDRVAHHVREHNPHSVGIELVNTGRYPDWFHSEHQDDFEPYPDAQIDSLVGLIALLGRKLPALVHIAGHQDLDTAKVPASDDRDLRVARHRGPGPTFPWAQVLDRCALTRIP